MYYEAAAYGLSALRSAAASLCRFTVGRALSDIGSRVGCACDMINRLGSVSPACRLNPPAVDSSPLRVELAETVLPRMTL